MKKLSLIAASVLAAAVMAPAAQANYTPNAYYNGYFRGGVQHGNDGKANKYSVEKVGRLGNENDTYGEIGLGADIADVDGVLYTINSMIALNGSETSTWNDSTGIAWNQYWLGIKGLIDWSKDATLWAGNRYYQRDDSHITDMKYINTSGAGAGLENLKIGNGDLSLAWIRSDNNTSYAADYGYTLASNYVVDDDGNVYTKGKFSVNAFDVRFNFTPWDGGWMQIANVYFVPERSSSGIYQYLHQEVEQKNSDGLQLVLSQSFSAGWNKTVFQYGHGAVATTLDYSSLGFGYWYADHSGDGNLHNALNGYRLLNMGETHFGDNFAMLHTLNLHYITNYGSKGYGLSETGTKSKKGVSLVVRPQYQLTKQTKLLAEVGFSYDKTEKYDRNQYTLASESTTERAQKYTIAYAIAPDASSLWSRPEFRFYISYIHGSDKQDMIGYGSSGSVTNVLGQTIQTSGTNSNTIFGIQAEAWW